jgi:hypothetical protein
LDTRPTTEDSGQPPRKDKPPIPSEARSGVELPPKVSELRWKLGRKAEQETKFRFYTLYDRIIRDDVLLTAWWLVLAHDGAPGIDGMTCQDIIDGPGAAVFLEGLREGLRTGRYRPQPVKRVSIPKPDGRLRPLGIPTVTDRIVQTAVLLVLEPIFEADFLDSSYGFRPGRNAHQAIDAIRQHLAAGFQERYADDFVVLARYQSRQLIDWIEGLLEGRFRLTVHREKTRIVKLHQPGESLDFLGFAPRYDRDRFGRDSRYLNVFPSAKAMARAREKVRELTGPHRCFVPGPRGFG